MKSSKKVVQGSNVLGSKVGMKGLGGNTALLQAQITAMRANNHAQKNGAAQQRSSQTMSPVQALQVSQTFVNQKHSSNPNTNLSIASPRQHQNQSMNINHQTVGSLEVSHANKTKNLH